MLYKSIVELPLKVFAEINKTGNLTLLGEGTAEEVMYAWDCINKELFDEFGISNKERDNLAARVRHVEYMRKYYLKGDKESRTLARAEEAEMAIRKGTPESMLKLCTRVSKVLEMRIEYNTVTVGEFFHYVQLANEILK